MTINDKKTFKRLDPVIHETAGTVKRTFYFRKDAVKSLTNFNKGTELHIITRAQLQRLRKHYRELYAIADCGHNLLLFKKHKKEAKK